MKLRNTLMSSLCLCLLAGCNLVNKPADPKPDDKAPDAPIVEKYTDQDHYSYLAECVQADVFMDSDSIVSAVDILKRTGKVSDVSRVDELRKKRIEPIKADDKVRIISILKGK